MQLPATFRLKSNFGRTKVPPGQRQSFGDMPPTQNVPSQFVPGITYKHTVKLEP